MSDANLNVDPRQAVKLVPVHIPKPWGQEIWYTGMEARGESGVELDSGNTPLSQYLAAQQGLTRGAELLLLKILDPSPTPVLGDLYFEVHEEKREVYVVTHIDEAAWPDLTGQIRFGMSQDTRQQFADDQAFRDAYLQTVQAYEGIRRDIDDGRRSPGAAADKEAAARSAMEAFTEVRGLHVGDVVAVPTWTPHALQHGVRVVEFQTATYERFIVSFAQKVITQDHWDSEHAIARMHLDRPQEPAFERVAEGVERIARFDHFNVWRANTETLTLPSHIPYGVLMNITGSTCVGGLELRKEEACFIPHDALTTTTIETDGQYVVAAPEL